MALFRRQQTGIGDYIDISMHDVTLGAMLNVLGPALAEDRQPVVAHERTTGGAALYRSYEPATADIWFSPARSRNSSTICWARWGERTWPIYACTDPARISNPSLISWQRHSVKSR